MRVIEERPVALALADRVGVQHQSPQAMLVQGGAARWNTSHHDITAAALQNAAVAAGQ